MKNNTHIFKKLIVGAILSLILCFGVFLQTPKVKGAVISPIIDLHDIPVGAVLTFNNSVVAPAVANENWKFVASGFSTTGLSFDTISFLRQNQRIGYMYYNSTVAINWNTAQQWTNNNYKIITLVSGQIDFYIGTTLQDSTNSTMLSWFNNNISVSYVSPTPQTTITFYSYTGAVYSTYTANQNEPLLMDFTHSEREGYTFRGWSFTSGAVIPDIVYGTEWTPTQSSYNLYEVWQDNGQVIIQFDPNGGTGTPPQAVAVQKNSNYTLPSNPGLTKTNYDFDGWSRNANASSGSSPGSQIEVLDTDFTLYAIWVLQKKILTLNLQGGNIPGGITNYNIDYGTTYNLNLLNTPVKTGFVFLGWGLTSDATEYISQITMTTNKTIYAIWGTQTQDLATITFNGNGSTGGAVPGSLQVIKGQQYTLPHNPGELVRAGYTFIGWGTTSDATTPIYDITPNANITLYAIWNELNFATIYLQVNGAAVATTKIYNGVLPTFYVRFNEFNNDYFYLQITANDGVNYSNVDYNYIWNIIYNSTDKYGRVLYTFNGNNIEKIIITTPNGTTEYDESAIDLAHYSILYYYNNNDVYTINIITEPNTDLNNFNNIVSSVFTGAQTLLNIKVGWFSLGSLVAVVLAIGVLFFVIRVGRGGSND